MDTAAPGSDDARIMSPKAVPKVPRLKRASPPLYVGQWIRALGKTPAEVSKGAPVNEGYLSSVISGSKKNPSEAWLGDVAAFLGIPTHLLRQPPPDPDMLQQLRGIDPAILGRLAGPRGR